MRGLGSQPQHTESEAISGWLIGAICTVVLVLSLTLGLGRALNHRTHPSRPPQAIPSTSVATGSGTPASPTPDVPASGTR